MFGLVPKTPVISAYIERVASRPAMAQAREILCAHRRNHDGLDNRRSANHTARLTMPA